MTKRSSSNSSSSNASPSGSAMILAILAVALALVYMLVRPSFQGEGPVALTPTPAAAPGGGESAPAGATSVGFFVFPEDDEQQLLDAIGSARKRVYMKMYLLSDYRVIDALAQAIQNGAQVRAMLEEHPFGGGGTTGEAVKRLKQAGVEFKYTNPVFRFSHEKSFVVDDTAYILTANMTKSAFTRNREFGVIRSDPADVAEVAASFQADWDRADFTPSSRYLVWSPVNSRQRVNQVIQSALRTLEVYCEVAQDEQQLQLLADAARRGVQVRLITSPSKSGDESGGSDALDPAQTAGVRIRYVSSPYIHAKSFVADGAFAFVGSENISATSLDFNRELGILLSDPAAIQRIQAAFEKDWAKGKDR